MAAERLLNGGTQRLLFSNGPDGLSVAKLRKAGVEDACRARGVRIPGEVEIVGLDDVELARLVKSPLTTAAQPAPVLRKTTKPR